jgi:hypothetical protein
MKKVLLKIWSGWKKIAFKIARFNTIILISLFYLLLLAPMGAVMRLFGWDPLQSSRHYLDSKTNWKPVEEGEPTMESLHHQS